VSGLTSITVSRALVSDTNGLPIASSVSTTQLQYLASATGTTGTTSTSLVFSTSPVLTTPNIGAATGTSLDVTGALTSGVASTTAGTLVLRNGTNAFTQTIRGTNYGSSIIYDWPTGTPTAGQVLSASAPSPGVITLSWASASASIAIGSTVTSGTTGSLLFVGSGPVLSQNNANLFWDNSTIRLGISTASPTGILHINSTNVTATIPHLLLAGTTTAPTGSVGGSLWYFASGTTEYLGLYKSNAALVTKVITKDRNPDFVSATTSGVIVSDANGTLTKSADLTALGVYSAYADVTVSTTSIASLISGSIVGSTTLPANFFAVGKTLRVVLLGTVTCTNGDDSTITLSIGASTQTFAVTNLPNATAQGFIMELFYVCRTAGASASVSVTGSFTLTDSTAPQSAHVYAFPTNTISGFNSASSQVFNIQNTWAQSGSTVVVQTNTAYYLN
jgi:hypothetical protein